MSSEQVKGELERGGITLERTLLSKADGTTFVARARRGGQALVVKWVANAAPERIRRELQREQAFYAQAAGLSVAPRCLDTLRTASGSALVLEWIEGVSLREWLGGYVNAATRDVSQLEACIERVLEAARALYALPLPADFERDVVARSAGATFGLLVHSGPAQRLASPREQSIKRVLHKAGVVFESLALGGVGTGLAHASLIHGDLHWNNVVLRADGSACIIDFGTACAGDAGLDAAYLISMIDAALPHGSLEQRALRRRALALIETLGGDARAYARLLDVLAIGTSINARLQLSSGSSALFARALYLPRLALAAARALA